MRAIVVVVHVFDESKCLQVSTLPTTKLVKKCVLVFARYKAKKKESLGGGKNLNFKLIVLLHVGCESFGWKKNTFRFFCLKQWQQQQQQHYSCVLHKNKQKIVEVRFVTHKNYLNFHRRGVKKLMKILKGSKSSTNLLLHKFYCIKEEFNFFFPFMIFCCRGFYRSHNE